jgi:hypothetical protein
MANSLTIDTFDQIATACLNAIQDNGKIHDQVYSGDPVFALLNSKGKKRTEDGGDYIRVHLRRAKRSGGGSYAGWDQGAMAPVESIGYALFPWAQYRMDVAIDNATILKNSGKKQIVDLIADKVDEATSALQDMMTVDLYGDGTGNGGKDITGLGAALLATGTYGGIARASNTWWAAKASAGSDTISTSMLRNKINTVRGPSGDPQKQGKVDMIVMPQDLYESFEGLYEEKLRVPTSDLSLGQLGFEALKFKGAEVTWSPNVTAGEVLFLSTSALGLVVHSQRDFTFTGFEDTQVNGQDGRVAWLYWMGNLVANECRRLGKLTAVTA